MRATSSTAAIAHTIVAAVRRPGNCSGSDAAATATIPVPMIDANQFGVRFDTIRPGRSSSRNSRRSRAPCSEAAGAWAKWSGHVLSVRCAPWFGNGELVGRAQWSFVALRRLTDRTLDLDTLEVLVRVADTGSLTRAADVGGDAAGGVGRACVPRSRRSVSRWRAGRHQGPR